MILVGGEPVVTANAGGEKENLLWTLLEHPVLVAAGNALRETELQTIKPPRPSGNEDNVLRPDADGLAESDSPTDLKYVYIFQKEFATASPLFAEMIGTDEITTCLGLAIRDPLSGFSSFAEIAMPVSRFSHNASHVKAQTSSRVLSSLQKMKDGTIQLLSIGRTSLGHFDTADCVLNGVNDLVNSVISLSSNTFQVHLLGAFDDSSEYSDGPGAIRPILNAEGREELKNDTARHNSGWSWPLAMRMIEILQNSVHNFELETCFILKHNTTIGPTGYPSPTIRGFVVETSSGRLLPAKFEIEARCPDGTVRGVCTTTACADPKWNSLLVSPYDTLSDTFKISPFKWSGKIERYARYMLTLSDAVFLDTFSTSPHAEGPDFLPVSRRIFSYIKDFPDWEQTFPNQEARVFTRTKTGGWTRNQPS